MGRSVTFLELFYDLVYVVLIAEVAHGLAAHPDAEGLLGYVFMFVIVWIAWINGTLYHDLHGNNDVRTRIFTFLQMFTVAAMAVFAHGALGETSIGFALSYAGFQLILTYLWWRTGVHDPEHRPLSRPYVGAFLLATLLLIGSVFVEPPARYYLWGASVLATLAAPLVSQAAVRKHPEAAEELERSSTPTDSLVERFGLFTIIVLGEVIVGTVRGVAVHHHLTVEILATGALGMALAFALWWLYFDFVSHRMPSPGQSSLIRWAYLHLPMTMGIAAVGTAVLNVVEHAGEPLPAEARWLLVGATSVAVAMIALLTKVIVVPEGYEDAYVAGRWAMAGAALVILLLGFSGIRAVALLGTATVLLLAPVFFALRVWVRVELARREQG
jgi:low temperature requirement protein LtrA